MKIHKLTTTDAFIVFDLDDAETSVGIVRQAPKILQDGAAWMARSLTYAFAVLEQKRGGASAGVNARSDARDDAVAAFVAEIEPMVGEQRFLPDPGKGIAPEELAPLRSLDGRCDLLDTDVDGVRLADDLVGLGAAVSAETACGDLSGRRVVIEGLSAAGVAAARHLAARGCSVVGVSGTKASVRNAGGIDIGALGEALAAGDSGIEALGESGGVLDADADILLAGSKAGVVAHGVAESMSVKALVPIAPLPVTARAFAMLRRADAVVLPDFVTTAGPLVAGWADAGASADDLRAQTTDAVRGVLDEVGAHEDGHLLGACYKAEAFLSSWQDSLPFGRPLAA